MRRPSSPWSSVLLLGVAAVLVPVAAMADAPSPRRQAELRHLLEQDCGSCHGLTLKGGLGPALSPSRLTGRDDDFLIDTILFGRRGTPMPPWGHELTRDDARWMVDHMRTR
ncbi:MAG: cytochrome c [Alphaproteobacteria bacterium]|nr:cytochrome c [Alphaproteobacteria bacterium]